MRVGRMSSPAPAARVGHVRGVCRRPARDSEADATTARSPSAMPPGSVEGRNKAEAFGVGRCSSAIGFKTTREGGDGAARSETFPSNMMRKGQVKWLGGRDTIAQAKSVESLFGVAA